MKLCPHFWREMTGEQDYGRFGPHWGNYKGYREEICRVCGVTRRAQPWQAWKYELDDAKKRVEYLLSVEPKK
jgi:hypothetical protein